MMEVQTGKRSTSTPSYEMLETMVREKMRGYIQDILEEEVTNVLGREKHERIGDTIDAPRGYRNGHGKKRRLALMNGTVTIRRPRVHGLEERFESRALPLIEVQQQVVKISISDDGIGIPSDRLDTVFDMGRSFKPNGNGLGLYQAKEIVSALGGEIKIASSEGKGTTVTITMLRESDGTRYDQADVSSFDFVLIDDSKVRRLNGQKRVV